MTDRTTEMLALADKLDFAAGNTNGCLYSQRKMLTDAAKALRASGAYVEGQREALEDCQSHRASWRNAIEIAHRHALVVPPDIDDKCYWQHELMAFDRVFATLASLPLEAQESDGRGFGSLPSGENDLPVTAGCRPSDTPTSGDAVREALERARDAIASLTPYALGGVEVENTDGSGGAYQYPIRDELLADIDAALSKPEAAPAGEVVAWRSPIETVADLVNNLLTLDQAMAVHTAYFITRNDGRTESRTRSPSLSRERVANSRIKTGDKSVPYSLVIWASQDERATPPAITEREKVAREALSAARVAIQYSLDMGGTDPAGVLLQALNKCDTALDGGDR